MVPVLLRQGMPPVQVAELTDVSAALIHLIAAEPDTAQLAGRWRGPQASDGAALQDSTASSARTQSAIGPARGGCDSPDQRGVRPHP
jgi:hypothetical protein